MENLITTLTTIDDAFLVVAVAVGVGGEDSWGDMGVLSQAGELGSK